MPLFIGAALLGLLVVGAALVRRAHGRADQTALAARPKLVSFVTAQSARYQPSRSYVGTLTARAEASVGPQLIAAYVDTVLVRPGAVVKKGQVLATLDCRTASTESRAIAMKARALDAREQALEDESARYQSLLDGGFVAENDVEQQLARSKSEQAQLLAEQAALAGTALQVDDCILRAPFDGEIATRLVDPGAFVRPGAAVVSVVDRRKVIVMVDAPERDFEVVAPETPVALHVLSTGQDLTSTIARRAPKADPSTRTVHFEIDVPDPDRQLPVGTTARVRLHVGTPVPATRIPLYAASVKDDAVDLFVVDGETAHERTVHLEGEADGQLFLGTELAPGCRVVAQGRELLSDGDRVSASPELREASKRSGR